MRYGRHIISLEVFLGSVVSMTSLGLTSSYSYLGSSLVRICLHQLPTYLNRLIHKSAHLTFSVAPSYNDICRYRNINLFPINYPFRTRLRDRLTHRGSPCRWMETLGLRRTGFSPVLSLLMPTFSLLYAPAYLTVHTFSAEQNAPLPLYVNTHNP